MYFSNRSFSYQAILFMGLLLIGCASSKKNDQLNLARDMNSTRMKALTKNQDKKKNKAAMNAAKGIGMTFDKEPYNAYTDKRRDEKRKKRIDLSKPQYSDPSYFGYKRKPKELAHKRKKRKKLEIVY